MAKILCVLYDDPVDGYPTSYPRDDIPKIEHYPDGQTLPTPSAIDFRPGQLLGSISGELGLRKFLEAGGHQLVVTEDKDRPNSDFDRELVDADVVISQPFWPAYLTAERIAKAKNLKLAITAGIGSDHVDLQAAIERGITVAEVTYCNSISVAEHVVMMILSLVRMARLVTPVMLKQGKGGACYSRVYDKAHLDKHPGQQTTEVRLALEEDQEAGGEPCPVTEESENHGRPFDGRCAASSLTHACHAIDHCLSVAGTIFDS